MLHEVEYLFVSMIKIESEQRACEKTPVQCQRKRYFLFAFCVT